MQTLFFGVSVFTMEHKGISVFNFYGKHCKTLDEALESVNLAETDRVVDIVLLPPEIVDTITDEEDIDEDNLYSSIPNDVPGELEVIFSSDDDEDNLSLATLQKMWRTEEPPKKKRKTRPAPDWHSNLMSPEDMESTFTQEKMKDIRDKFKNSTPIEIFESIVDDVVIQLMVDQSNLYASQNNRHAFSVTKRDIKIFLGVLLFSGYHQLPRERLYWSLDEDFDTKLVYNAISRNRYCEIKKNLHFTDNTTLNKSDKMAKLRPLMDVLNKNFQQWGIFFEVLSIDEAMVKYFGHHSSKQFLIKKPVRFGYKDWMLCSAKGYCFAFDTYCGAKGQSQNEEKIPLGSKVVLDLLKVVPKPSDHIVFFDNFFTSFDLLAELRELGFRSTGTVRDNRTKKCPLSSPKEMKKMPRGSYEHKCDKKGNILVVRWKDNSVVTMATNYDTVFPLGSVKRWSAEEKKKVDVPQPKLFSSYNSGMGGVDLHDQAVNNYRISIFGKKWWWPLFTHMINMAVVNAWHLHRISHTSNNLDLLGFVREVTRFYLRSFDKTKKNRPSGSVPASIRATEGGHFPKKEENQRRCKVCKMKSRWHCIRCNVPLCIERECFINYHTII